MKKFFIVACLMATLNCAFAQWNPSFKQRFSLNADFGATQFGGFTMDLNLSLGQVWIGMNMSLPKSPAQGIDFTSVIFSNQYVEQQQYAYYDVYSGTFNLCLGYMLNENNVIGAVVGEAAYKDILQYYGSRLGNVPDYYHITLNTYDYFNYGIFATHNFTSRKSPYRLYVTGIWTRFDGFGLMGGVGYAFLK